MSIRLLKVRPAKEDEREKQTHRGPLYMEPALAALHSLKGTDREVSLEIGMGRDGKIGFFVRGSGRGTRLAESQIYAQYPDVDIETITEDPFVPNADEEVVTVDLCLTDPEIFPIKRHPQFDDLLTRTNVDPIAGITSTLSRSLVPGMRGHVQVAIKPLTGSYRRRALRFIPLLQKGLASISVRYAALFTRMQLARGWRRVVLLPVAFFLGGFRAWPGFSKFFTTPVNITTGEIFTSDPEEEDMQRASARSHDRENSVAAALDKVNRLLFLCNVRISVIAPKGHTDEARAQIDEIVGGFRQFALPNCNALKAKSVKQSSNVPYGIKEHPFILSVEEVVTLWHIPTVLVRTPNIDWVLSKKLEPPINLPISTDKDVTTLGEAVFRGERSQFGILPDDRRRHIYCIGKTGMGKSTLLENMIFSDIHEGKGVGVIDPHGDLIDAILQFIPKERSNDIILIDPADRDFPISFNMLEATGPDQRPIVASGLMGVFTKLWPDVWSERMKHILRNTLLALLEYQGSSMLGIMRMFADDAYRTKVVDKITDPLVKSFWKDEYEQWSEKYRTEAISAIQNKVGQLLSTPIMRNIVGQVKSSVDIRHAMDTGKIVLVNLSKGKLGEDVSAFLGSMLVTKFQIDAMSRADIPEKDRRDFYLYVDEFQNFATESFATILSEARKYRLSLTMANQYVAQLLIDDKNTALRDAVFGNVGSIISFQVGSDDAEEMSLQFEEMVTAKDILSLPKYHAYARVMIEGVPSKPFSVTTLPPPQFKQDPGRVDTFRSLSRERYSKSRVEVEGKIMKWAQSAAEGRKDAKKAGKAKEKEEEELKKARKKGMKLDEYRKWRDREMWLNDFNMIRKKNLMGEKLNEDEKKEMAELEKKLKDSGGVPELSKTLLQMKEKKERK
ncbi:type IV secretory system conjugative DNA transfer family protein [Patescibacteria group bacterium]|nr:type IV secretory system conjugative DNA transfer family protein [Patescibacteria group bacterium]